MAVVEEEDLPEAGGVAVVEVALKLQPVILMKRDQIKR